MYTILILLHISHVMRKSVFEVKDQGADTKWSVWPQKLAGDLNLVYILMSNENATPF